MKRRRSKKAVRPTISSARAMSKRMAPIHKWLAIVTRDVLEMRMNPPSGSNERAIYEMHVQMVEAKTAAENVERALMRILAFYGKIDRTSWS